MDLLADVGLTRLTRPDGGVEVLPGLPNGLIYFPSGVSGLSGTVKGRHTILTDPDDSVVLSGHLVYAGDPREDPRSEDMLGILTGQVVVSSAAPADLEVQALILAARGDGTGGLLVEDWERAGAKGKLRLMGGLLQERARPVGELSDGLLISGYARDFRYDARLAYQAPPFFPATRAYTVLHVEPLADGADVPSEVRPVPARHRPLPRSAGRSVLSVPPGRAWERRAFPAWRGWCYGGTGTWERRISGLWSRTGAACCGRASVCSWERAAVSAL